MNDSSFGSFQLPPFAHPRNVLSLLPHKNHRRRQIRWLLFFLCHGLLKHSVAISLSHTHSHLSGWPAVLSLIIIINLSYQCLISSSLTGFGRRRGANHSREFCAKRIGRPPPPCGACVRFLADIFFTELPTALEHFASLLF